MFEIKSTRKLEQYSLSPQRRSLESYKLRKRKKNSILFCVRDHGDLYNTWSLNQSTDRNVDIKSSVGFFFHYRFQHAQNWVIRGYKKFVARIRIGSPFRCAVTDSQLLRLMESLSCSQNRTSAHRKGGPSTSLHHTKDACWQVGTQGNSKNCYRPRIK